MKAGGLDEVTLQKSTCPLNRLPFQPAPRNALEIDVIIALAADFLFVEFFIPDLLT